MTYTHEQLAQMSDEDLRRVIAELVGWSELENYEYWAANYDGDGWVTTLRGTLSGYDLVEVPDWPRDANAALELLKDTSDEDREGMDAQLSYRVYDEKWEVVFMMHPRALRASQGISASPVRAICEAWVLWKQSQQPD
jgi:hypothetical protein